MRLESRKTTTLDLLAGIAVLTGTAAKVPLNLAGEVARPLARGPVNLSDIADGVRLLPELLDTLARIDQRVDLISSEVGRMRTSVDEVHDDIETLTRHVDGVQSSLHPFGRLRRKMTRADSDDARSRPQ